MFAGWFARRDGPLIRGEGLVLRGPVAHDFAEWRSVRLESRNFLKPFEPRWSETDLSERVFQARLRRTRDEMREGTEYSFFIFLPENGATRLVGGLTLSNIRRRVAQHVNLGYWMGVNHAGKGIMTRAVGAILPFVFEELGLHRIHAACLPANTPSRRVLEKNQFREEGYAENYLQIDGAWRDHVLYGLTRERFQGHDVSA